jgi:methyltransferase (TIGR00027 family)
MVKISQTAAYIVVKFYGLTKDPKLKKLFPAFIIEFYEKMVGFLPRHLSWYQGSLNSPFWRRVFIWSEELLLPGDLMHIVSRKYYMTQEVERSLNEGYEQVVSLGSGFDHLGAYVASKGISVFELDQDFMIEQKRAFLSSSKYEYNNLKLASIDVTKKRIKEVLLQLDGFDPSKKTLFVAEGFFDYLSLSPSENILEDIRELNSANKLLTTFFSLDELNLFHRFVFTSGVTLVGESLKFKLEKEEFVDFLKEMNFILETEISHKQIPRELLKPSGVNLPVLKGFYLLSFTQTG